MEDVATNGFILDGFPRTLAQVRPPRLRLLHPCRLKPKPHLSQAQALEEVGITFDHFLFLDVDDDVIVKRIGGRRIDPVSGNIYHIDFNPAPTNEIAERLVKREDDTTEKITKRLRDYHHHMPSLLSYYASICKRIEGVSNDPVIVFDNIAQVLRPVTRIYLNATLMQDPHYSHCGCLCTGSRGSCISGASYHSALCPKSVSLWKPFR